MEAVLADALLAYCRDPCALLLELGTWDSGAPMLSVAEKLETLHLLLRRLSEAPPQALSRQEAGGTATNDSEKQSVDCWALLRKTARELALGRCLPLLREAGLQELEGRRAARAACGVLRHCAELCEIELAVRVGGAAAAEMEAALVEMLEHIEVGSRVEAAFEALGAVVPLLCVSAETAKTRAVLERVARTALRLLRQAPREAEAVVAVRLLLVLSQHGDTLQLVSDGLLGGEAESGSDCGYLNRSLLLLSVLPERVLWPLSTRDTQRYGFFWQLVQEGLTSADCLSRKRARHLLSRALEANLHCMLMAEEEQRRLHEPSLFWWSAEKNDELLQFWENYILIMETLEANQIHVIKPVFPKLSNLFQHAVCKEKDCWLFHPSWLISIYKRMFESENKTLVKEGVHHFLEFYEATSFPRPQAFSEFVIGPLMDAVAESSLYSRSSGQLIGTCPLLGKKLEKFLTTFVLSLPEADKGSFLLQFIQKITSRHWCAVPLLFICKALAHIPACRVWGLEGLLALREVMQCTMITHQILLRGAAQCYLLQTAMNLADVETLTFTDISNFLMALRSEESLCRGTILWKQLCDWLHMNDACFKNSLICDHSTHQGRSSLSIYVQNLVKAYLKAPISKGDNSPMPDWYEAKLVATMILLASDVELMKKDNDKENVGHLEMKCFLHPLLDGLSKLSTNAYLSTVKTDKILQLLLKLLQTASIKSSNVQDDAVLNFLWDSVMSAAASVWEFILRRLTSELSTVSDLDRCNLYLSVLSEMVNVCSHIGWKRGPSVQRFIFSLVNASLQNLEKISDEKEPKLGEQIQRVVSMASLSAVCEITAQERELQLDPLDALKVLIRLISFVPLNQALKKPCYTEEKSSLLEDSTLSRGWGKIVARYIHDQWVCISFILRKYHNIVPAKEDKDHEIFLHVVQKPVGTLQSALEVLTILPSDQVLPVFCCMKILVPKLLDSAESLCIQAINFAWKIMSSLSNTQMIFWPNLKAFVQFVFDGDVLAVAANRNGQTYSKLQEIICQMIEMSATKTGVFNVVMSYCCQSWITPISNDDRISLSSLSNARDYIELISEGCVFGNVFRKDQRLIQDVCAFIENLGDDCAANIATKSTNRDDHYVRICAIKFLCLLDGSNMSHKMFIKDLLTKLLDKDELVSKSKIRYYVNSLQHRIKNRLWQTLLVLFPKLDENILSEILDKIFQAGLSNNQASVKYSIEWIIILILHRYPQFLNKFWDCFCYGEEKLKTSICTFLSVLTHFNTILENTRDQVQLLKKALVVVLQWCFNHNFSVRLYALIALKKLWTICKRFGAEEFEALAAVIESSLQQVENVQNTGNAKKNWQRIQDHFFFSTFHPLEDFSLETIFYTLPSLSEVVEEEWISPCKFTRFSDIPLGSAFQLFNSRAELRDLKPSDWSQQDIGSTTNETDIQSDWTDIQKKIIPWKNSVPDMNLELVYQVRSAKLGKSKSSLIVVASLVEKATNLGGLCRTCEIFGASTLVMGNLAYVNDKQFQYLSVSAEQWLPVIEVKPPQLLNFLHQKKTEGYTVIGVEQTAKSSNLTEYSFPVKSLLLLGNEREGIPAKLIHHLDVCVEIPQQGIIRSLNVHVSGALLIWEYTRQQIMKNKGLK
ncbi:tRNA (guanosine(18)-2'-O)-methyltransferase TARBP1 [Microcaecilia unicolor]|uniref:tRNA (guanosine(18)-2'-O)-methyltransferase TARBP1 n=1 Tax=Microcaecilia unicolor TaxID=1415580 RepID=A0A6P7XN51_9AMPH|nr:probable methyltransferase TARBP1 [Microcaecilia unicolor]